MIDITLHRAKYRNPGGIMHRSGVDPIEGTRYFPTESHSYRTRTGNSSGPTPKRSKSPIRPRKRAYGPF